MVWLGYEKQKMPAVGDAFLVPLAKGVNTFCRVVRLHDKRAVCGGKKLGASTLHSVVIACARRTGRRRPTQAELDARSVRDPEWNGLAAARQRNAVAKLLAECAVNLRALVRPDREAKLAVIEATVDKPNAWNDRACVIETPERSALCSALDDIGHAAGLRGHDLAGPYRDW